MIRATVELGSGCIRLQVAEVDRALGRITNVLLIQTEHVEFARDLKIGTQEYFSSHIMDQAVSILIMLKEKARTFTQDPIVGVATEAFRRSKNAQTLLERIYKETNIAISIATHEEEALFGFFNAKSLSELDEERLISWDTGAGSFQITALEPSGPEMYLGRIGRVFVEHYIIETLRKKPFSQSGALNPVTNDEALQTIAHIQQELASTKTLPPKKLQDSSIPVIAIGAHPKQIPIGTPYTKEDLKTLLFSTLDKDDATLGDPDAHFFVIDLILAYSVMQSLNIHQAVRYSTKLAGNTSGLLIHPNLW